MERNIEGQNRLEQALDLPHDISIVSRKQDESVMTEAPEGDDPSERLEKLIAMESTHFQWRKLLFTTTLIGILGCISHMKGGKTPEYSWLGLSKCEPLDWGLLGILLAVCLCYFSIGY